MKKNKMPQEIDVLNIIITLFKEWKSLLKFVCAAGLVGVIVAFSTPKRYTASVVLAPEIPSSGLGVTGSIKDLISSFGVNLGQKLSMDAIYPEIYPDVFASTDFIRNLLDVRVRVVDDYSERSYLLHLKNDTRIPFWNYPKKWLANVLAKSEPGVNGSKSADANPYWVSKKDAQLYESIKDAITCFIDNSTSEIVVSITDQDPLVAAIMVDTLQRRLQEYIISYRTKKAHEDYDYYSKMAGNAETKYRALQDQYTEYCDSHRNSTLKSVSAQEQSLKDNMSTAFDIYLSMNKMRELSLARIQERTPAFTIIQSAMMPTKPSSMSKLETLVIFAFLGVFANIIWIVFRKIKG